MFTLTVTFSDATRELAQAALDKARKFMKAATYKAAQIEEV